MADTLMNRILDVLQPDAHVSSAWLAGSRGRGDSDEYSDIDIWVALDDEIIAAVVNDPRSFVERVAPVCKHIIAPEIAPEGGAFITSWLEWGESFEHVDWYIAPASTACRANDTQLLFGDTPVCEVNEPTPFPAGIRRGKVEDNLKLALLMTNNMVKRARRRKQWKAANSARNADACLAKAAWILEHGTEPAFGAPTRSYLPDAIPGPLQEFVHLAYVFADTCDEIANQAGVDLKPATIALRRKLATGQTSMATTGRIALRPMTPDDADAIYSYRSLPEVNAYTYTPVWTDIAQAREHTEKYSAKFERGAFGRWMLVRADTGEAIGDVMLAKHEELQGTAEIGYMLHPDHAGHGFATEAVILALRIGFEEWGLHRIYARVDDENIASARICEKIGMRLEARMIESDRNPMRDNRWSTELNYAMLKHEWNARHRVASD